MALAVLRPHDCLKNRLHLDAYGSRPTPPAKHHRKKFPRSPPPTASPSSHHPPPLTKPGRCGPPPPYQAAKSGRGANLPRDHRKSPPPRKDGAVSGGKTRSQKPLLMGEVRILKRGEELKPSTSSFADLRSLGEDSVLCSTNRLGPEPETLPRKVTLAVPASAYAGPAFFTASPSPSSLPMPSFFLKAKGDEAAGFLLARLPAW